MDRVYLGQRRQYGGAFTVYRGTRRQIGGSIFGTIGRFLRPLASKAIKAIAPTAKKAIKHVGKSALQVGLDTVSDAIEGKNVGEALATRAKGEAKRQLKQAIQSARPQTRKRKKLAPSASPPPKRRRVAKKGKQRGGKLKSDIWSG